MYQERQVDSLKHTLQVADSETKVPEEIQTLIDQLLDVNSHQTHQGESVVAQAVLRKVLVDDLRSDFFIRKCQFEKFPMSAIKDDGSFGRQPQRRALFFRVADAREILRVAFYTRQLDSNKLIPIIQESKESNARNLTEKGKREPTVAITAIQRVFFALMPELKGEEARKFWENDRSLTTVVPKFEAQVAEFLESYPVVYQLLKVCHAKLSRHFFGQFSPQDTIKDVGCVRYANEKAGGLFITLANETANNSSPTRTFYFLVNQTKKSKSLQIEVITSSQQEVVPGVNQNVQIAGMENLAAYIENEVLSHETTKKIRIPLPIIAPEAKLKGW